MNQEKPKYKFKLVVLGQGAVGKSNLVLRFAQNDFMKDYIPTLQDTFRKTIFMDNKMVQLEILDTAGQEQFSQLLDYWIQEGDGFILCYAINSLESFKELPTFKHQILSARDDKPKILIVGTKNDLEEQRQVGNQIVKYLGLI